jgi:glutaredoxin-related protein
MNWIVRRTVGHAVNLFGWLTRPEQIVRTEQERKLLAAALKGLRLYDYKTCPKSLKLRQELHRLNLDLEYCDIRSSEVHRNNLLAQFGRLHAPCLRIEEQQSVRWLDDCEQIIHYLNQRFAPAANEVFGNEAA